MSLSRIILSCLFLLVAFQSGYAQEAPKAELIDNFGVLIDDDILSRFDMFSTYLDKPKTSAYIIVYGTKDDPVQKYLYQRKLQRCHRNENSYDKVFTVGLGEEKDKFEVEFWKVPEGAENPQYAQIPADYKLPEFKEPRLIHSTDFSNEYCPLGFDMEFYSKFLKSNSEITGKIVIGESSLKLYQKAKQNYLCELAANKVSQQQVRFVRRKNSGDVEFWLTPKGVK